MEILKGAGDRLVTSFGLAHGMSPLMDTTCTSRALQLPLPAQSTACVSWFAGGDSDSSASHMEKRIPEKLPFFLGICSLILSTSIFKALLVGV